MSRYEVYKGAGKQLASDLGNGTLKILAKGKVGFKKTVVHLGKKWDTAVQEAEGKKPE
tara:strand:- start:112 stop:285 length:174 start_codon:yes stop_codon:yes gene_type:complete